MNKATLLTFSFLSLSILLATYTPCMASHEPSNPPNQPKSAGSMLARLAAKAESLYGKSSADKQGQPEQPATPALPVVQPLQVPQEQLVIKPAPDAITASNPIMAKHKEYSDEWWKALWGSCKGCNYSDQDSRKPIDCKQMLADNPQWQEVKDDMNQKTKDIIMKRAVMRFHDDQDACNLACAACAGGNPDSRMEHNKGGGYLHTALHATAGGSGTGHNYHNPLFRLLLSLNADPNLKCTTYFPDRFVRSECREDLERHGGERHHDDD